MRTKLHSSFYILPAAFLLACALPLHLRAATLVVTSTADSGPGTLRAALASAGNGDVVDARSVSGTITLASGQLNVTTNVTILGPGPGLLTVSGNNSSRVFNVTGTNVTISGLTVAKGYTLDNGGGIYNNPGATLIVSNCTLRANSATNEAFGYGYGGGCYNASTLTISASTFSGNSAFNGGGCWNLGTLTISASILSTNSAANYGGGCFNEGTLTISASTFSGNAAAAVGGGCCNFGILTISASTFSGNSAASFWGGGCANGGTLTISASTFNGNSAAMYGGGCLNYDYGTLTISASTFSGNSASSGGGLGNWCVGYSDSVVATINSSTFSSNSTSGGGGGCIYNDGSRGGSATVQIGDTLLNGGAAAAGNLFNTSGTITSAGYNLSSDSASGLLTNATDILNTNPLLGPLQNNGGPTWTCALLPGSPAIDQGKRDALPALALNTDQRGYPRPVDLPGYPSATGGDASDIGAYEFQRLPLFVSQTGRTVTVYWQNQPGWRLQQNAGVAAPAGWTSNTAWTTANGTNYLNLTSPTGKLFFRLTQP
jgi:hypothetical protein